MHFRKTFCAIPFFVWANFVLGETITWSMYQYDGIDDVYIQTRKSEARSETHAEPDYNWMGNVCHGIIETGVPEMAARNDFPTIIRGTISEVQEQPSYWEDKSIKRYNLVVPNLAEFVLDLGLCTDDSTNKYFLTRGYEKDSLFFLFAFNKNTQILALRAIVQEDVQLRVEDSKAIESSYVQLGLLNFEILIRGKGGLPSGNPKKSRSEMREDPICTLSDVDKLRLCILLMNVPPYKSKYSFSPRAENVGRCTPTIMDLSTVDKVASSFTFRCSATSIDNPSLTIPIHISRSYKDYEVNTYTEVNGEEEVKLDHGFKKIFFVLEPHATEIQTLFVANGGQGAIDTIGGSPSEDQAFSVGSEGYHGSSNDAYAAAAVMAMTHSDVDGDGDGDGDGGGDK